MKIKVSDIDPNPFRDLVRNPIQRDKVESLKSSISDTGFWDNIVVRPKPAVKGKYELAYGHHRLTGVKELGIEFVDVPCRELNDAVMLKMMVEENRSDWAATPAVVNESVWKTKQYLDEILDKYETLESFRSGPLPVMVRSIFPGTAREDDYTKSRQDGVGVEKIQAFLGNGWKFNTILVSLHSTEEDSARAQAERLRRRQEREAAKAEAARQEAERQAQLKREAEERARQEAEEAARLAAEEEARKARQAEEERVRKAREAERNLKILQFIKT